MQDAPISTTPENYRDPLSTRVGRLVGTIAPIVLYGGVAALQIRFTRNHSSLLTLFTLFLPAMLLMVWFEYVRSFRPELAPRPLAPDSPHIVAMRKLQRGAAWGIGAGLCLAIAIFLISGDAWKRHPLLAPLSFIPAWTALAAYPLLRQYIAERTREHEPPVLINRRPGRPLTPSDYKPFQSDHWGQSR